MDKMILNVRGMHCASCASTLENALTKIKGVKEANCNFSNGTATIYGENIFDVPIEKIRMSISSVGFEFVPDQNISFEMRMSERKKEVSLLKRKLLISLIFSLPLIYISMMPMINQNLLPPFLLPDNSPVITVLTQLILTIPILFVGRGFFVSGVSAVLHKTANMDTLISLGVSAAFIYGIYALILILMGQSHMSNHLYFETSGVIITLILLGNYIETFTTKRTEKAVEEINALAPNQAVVLVGGKEQTKKVIDIRKGEIVKIFPGEKIPLDGIVLTGETFIDESMLTGESEKIKKHKGSEVFAGTMNTNGSITFEVQKIKGETVLDGIINLVEEASNSKLPIATLADKICEIFVPAVFSIAVIAGIVWAFITKDAENVINAFISVLVISCPCAMGLATPIAIMIGSGKSAKLGIMFREGKALETLAKINCVLIDKTGTLTKGEINVQRIVCEKNIKEDMIIKYAAGVEKHSEHSYAKAIVEYYESHYGEPVPNVLDFQTKSGIGVFGKIDDKEIKVIRGDEGVAVFYDSKKLGEIILSDEIKEGSKELIKKLKGIQIDTMMITGDNKNKADRIAQELGIDEYYYETLPKNKFEKVEELKKRGKKVLMVGDGINDAPALKTADTSIAIGGRTDIAMESSDIVLMNDNPMLIYKAIRIGNETLKCIKQNLAWAFGYNILAIPIAAGVLKIFGGPMLNPMIAAAVMCLSDFSLIINTYRLQKKKI